MTTARSGIPTTYRYSNMRSRLEARWAAFFDLVGWSWVYEPFDADGYIPDFLIEGKHPLLVEVGNCITQAEYEAKAGKATEAATSLGHDILIVGVSPIPLIGSSNGRPPAGWMGEFVNGEEPFFAWGSGEWHSCHPDQYHILEDGEWRATWMETPEDHLCSTRCHTQPCGRIAVHHGWSYFASRPCGHHDGDLHLGGIDTEGLRDLWAQAGNQVQWRPAMNRKVSSR